MELSAWIWFAIIFAIAFLFMRRPHQIAVAIACFFALFCVVYIADTADAWSPYYALRKIDLPNGQGFLILANGAQHQYAAPSRKDEPLERRTPSLFAPAISSLTRR